MGWASRNKVKGAGQEKPAPSTAARHYSVKYSPEHFKRGEGFSDARGRTYMCRPDGSLMRGGKSVQRDTAKPPVEGEQG